MLPGSFSAKGGLLLDFKPALSVGDLLLHHLDVLEEEAAEKSCALPVLADHVAKIDGAGVSVAVAA